MGSHPQANSISNPFSECDRISLQVHLLINCSLSCQCNSQTSIHLRSESKLSRMAWVLNSLLAVVSCNLLLALSSVLPTTSKSQDKLTFDCFNQDSSDFLTELQTYESLQEVYLRGFVFNGENVVKISEYFTSLQIKKISLVECDINDWLMSFFEFPNSLRSIHLERLNLSSKRIQSLINRLPSSMVSIEIMNFTQIASNTQTESNTKEASLSLARFSSLKEFRLEYSYNFRIDICQMLISLANIPLESIRISSIKLNSEEWALVLQEWKKPNSKFLFDSLQVFDVTVEGIDDSPATQLVQFLLSFPRLKILCFKKNWTKCQISLPPLPSQLTQFMLDGFEEVLLKDTDKSIYSYHNLTNITHLSVCGQFKKFPYILFKLSQLEYLDTHNAESEPLNLTLSSEDSFGKLKHLSIQVADLFPLLKKFNLHFPSIENIRLYGAYSEDFDCHLNEILSSKTLKRLLVSYFEYSNNLSLNEGLSSSIEELELNFVSWKFVSRLLKIVKFPNLKTIILTLKGFELNLNDMLVELSHIPQLSSLTLLCNYLPKEKDEEFSFLFDNLTFFRLNHYDGSFTLDHLISRMPKLIEFRVDKEIEKELKIKSTTNIRFLSLPISYSFESSGIFINLIKWMPNLIEFRNDSNLDDLLSPSDLAFYLKELKEYFGKELPLKIEYYCLPICLLEEDSDLFRFVQSKSSMVANYLERTYQFNKFNDTFQPLFTNEIDYDSHIKDIDLAISVKIIRLLFELERDSVSSSDILFTEEILQLVGREEDDDDIDLSTDHFYNSFATYLQRETKIEIRFNRCYFNFVKDLINAKKDKSLDKTVKILKHFFSTLQEIDETSRPELFNLFSECILNNSFCSLIDKIRDENLSEKEKKALESIQLSHWDELSYMLHSLSEKEYDQLIYQLNRILYQLNEILDEFEKYSIFEIFAQRLKEKLSAPNFL